MAVSIAVSDAYVSVAAGPFANSWERMEGVEAGKAGVGHDRRCPPVSIFNHCGVLRLYFLCVFVNYFRLRATIAEVYHCYQIQVFVFAHSGKWSFSMLDDCNLCLCVAFLVQLVLHQIQVNNT